MISFLLQTELRGIEGGLVSFIGGHVFADLIQKRLEASLHLPKRLLLLAVTRSNILSQSPNQILDQRQVFGRDLRPGLWSLDDGSPCRIGAAEMPRLFFLPLSPSPPLPLTTSPAHHQLGGVHSYFQLQSDGDQNQSG